MWTLAWLDTRSATATAGYEVRCEELPGGGLVPPQPPSPGPSPTPPLPVGVFVACVTNHGSRYDATFGYSSDNVGVLNVPIGPRNAVSPGPAGRATRAVRSWARQQGVHCPRYQRLPLAHVESQVRR
jgi:hypothetical protein